MNRPPRPRPTPRPAGHRPAPAWLRLPRWALALVGGLILAQLAGCAAQLWPPSAWSLSVDLPFMRPQPAPAAPVPSPPESPETSASARLKAPTNVSEALAYAEALCKLSPAELTTEIERLTLINAQDGHTALRAQQLALARQLASLYAGQQRLQESNEQQAQFLRERQKRIEQLNGQIAAMRAVEYSLPAAAGGSAPLASATKPAGAAAPRGATSFATPSAPTVPKPLPASAAEPATGRDEPDARLGEETHPPSEP